ncbi:hypothetical protein UZS93_14075 [Escherichia coli]|nr:hypothetical protein [Escherichia coli]MDY8957978.1 hypothetical protein [Escherichia coli]MDY8997139.1 hypothetical protein [Escherichia coli]MDY9034212.1 hypothetical protein [Escherichia coli]
MYPTDADQQCHQLGCNLHSVDFSGYQRLNSKRDCRAENQIPDGLPPGRASVKRPTDNADNSQKHERDRAVVSRYEID